MITICPLVSYLVPSSEGAFPALVLSTVLMTDHSRSYSVLSTILIAGGVRPLAVFASVRVWTEDEL